MGYEPHVQTALIKMVERGRVTKSDISRQSISEIAVECDGHTLKVSWYPGLWGRGSLRSLSYDGLDVPLTTRYASDVLHAMQDLAEREFERRASKIVSDFNL